MADLLRPLPPPRLRRSRRGPPRTRAAGFTLAELLIALVLISIITLLLFSALRLGGRAWEAVDQATERVADLRTAHQVIANLLRELRPESVPFEDFERPVFSGEREQLEWVAPLSDHVGLPGLYVLRLGLEQAVGRTRPRLVLTRWLLHPDVLAGGDDHGPWTPLLEGGLAAADLGPFDRDLAAGAHGRTVLLPRVDHFELRYFGIPEGADRPDWYEDWVDQPWPPLRVRIELHSPTQTWPPVLVALPGREAPVILGLGAP
ncbi:MAG: prepilin-type N-terminal cleavage/methylation domain-containing protein [Chromatiaceae bacterium]|nr:MAG: prepilin-type N-terminal cleavage/methylation domain-containing protein [Chromatiaceae bacterium]